MEKNNAFPLSLDFEGRHYKGEISPSEETGKNGMPVYFRVSIDGQLFAYLCCADKGWWDRDGSGKPDGLVNAIGDYITEYYQ